MPSKNKPDLAYRRKNGTRPSQRHVPDDELDHEDEPQHQHGLTAHGDPGHCDNCAFMFAMVWASLLLLLAAGVVVIITNPH